MIDAPKVQVEPELWLDRKLGGTARKVAILLRAKAGQSCEARYTLATICRILHLTTRQAKHAIKQLMAWPTADDAFIEPPAKPAAPAKPKPFPSAKGKNVFILRRPQTTWGIPREIIEAAIPDLHKDILGFICATQYEQTNCSGTRIYRLTLYGNEDKPTPSILRCCAIGGGSRVIGDERRQRAKTALKEMLAVDLLHEYRKASKLAPALVSINLAKLPALIQRYAKSEIIADTKYPSPTNGECDNTENLGVPNGSQATAEEAAATPATDEKRTRGTNGKRTRGTNGKRTRGTNTLFSGFAPLSRQRRKKGEPSARQGCGNNSLSACLPQKFRSLVSEVEEAGYISPCYQPAKFSSAVEAFLDCLPPDVAPEDFCIADRLDFDGLRNKSWPVLLSPRLADRFLAAVTSNYENRISASQRVIKSEQTLAALLVSPKPEDRLRAIKSFNYSNEGVVDQLLCIVKEDDNLACITTALHKLYYSVPQDTLRAALAARLACETDHSIVAELADFQELIGG